MERSRDYKAKLRAVKEEDDDFRYLPTHLEEEGDPKERVQEYVITLLMPDAVNELE